MARDDIPMPVRVLELGPGMAIYQVHLDRLREQDHNARTMEKSMFDRLVANIKKEAGLESLPLCAVIPGEPDVFQVISGHHRTRAARAADIMVIPVIVIERALTRDEITAKQLAHNALAGHDDLQVLRQLYESIENPVAKLESGLTDMDLRIDLPSWSSDAIDVEFQFEPVYILWASGNLARWEHLLEQLTPDARYYLANHEDWERFVDTVKAISKLRNIRNIAGIMVAMMDYAEKGIAAALAEQDHDSADSEGRTA